MKSTVKTIESTGTWTSGDGVTFYKFNIEFANGDKGGFLQKTSEITRPVGSEQEYEKEEKNGHTNIKFQPAKKDFIKSGFTARDPEEEKKRQLWIVRQSSLKASVELISEGKLMLDEVLTTAELFTEWVMGERPAQKLSELKKNDLPF